MVVSALDLAPTPDRVGTVIAGKYRIDTLLGEGGMGAVYESLNLWTSRRVAIKLLRPEYLSRQDTVRRFLQEARAASKVEHPNIVNILDMGQDERDGALFIVQEFLQGQDLEKRLKDPPRPSLGEIGTILIPILDALEAAHERGIIHRDLKPANIFLSARPGGATVPKLIDFGISKALDDEGFQKTRTGTTVGTPYYMSPEQARGDSDLDVRTDVWSIAAVLFEMLTGRGPFEAANYNQLIIRIVTERPPRVESLAPDTPADLAEALHAALEPDLEKRTPTVRAFRDALMQCAAFRGSAPDVTVTPSRNPPVAPVAPTIPDDHGHADTLPSTPSVRVPELDASVPGQPVTIRPSSRGPSIFAAAVVVSLAGLGIASYLRPTPTVTPSQLTGPPQNLSGTTPNLPGVPPTQLGTPQNLPQPVVNAADVPPMVPEAPPTVPEAPPTVPEAPPHHTVPSPNVRLPIKNAPVAHGRTPHDAGTSPVAPAPSPVRPVQAAPTPGDLLRPGIHYPGVRPDAG